MIRVPVTIKILVITNLHSILRVSHNSSTVMSSVEVHIIIPIVKQGIHPFMIRVLATIKVLVMTNLHFILRISNNSSTVVRSVEVPIIALIVKPGTSLENNRILEEILRTHMPNSPVVPKEPEGSDDYTKVTYDKEQCLSDHYTTPVTPSTYTPSIPETDEFIKYSVDDLVPILRESEVTFDSNLKCDMPATTPLPTTGVREENLDINLLLGEHLDTLSTGDREVDFNPSRDIEELERLLADDPVPVPRVFDEPLGHSDSISRSYDVTFSNPLFDFNDDYTLCYDNPLLDEEFEDISDMTWVMERPSYIFPHMPSPRPAAYSPTEVMYRFYHPHHTSGDGPWT
ncbi:hypothetical protein Tco_0800237 [Tanacetum coccineum]|uniref:NAC domain-containing protein n=1 Tax=Tanacetum coccineum TaxID=301880 RepID=A0ABQ4ZSI6_9ASTR